MIRLLRLSLPLRHVGPIVLIGILVLSFLLLTQEVRSTHERTGLVKRLAVALVSPILRGVHYLSSSLNSVWEGYIDLRGVRRENWELKEELDRMKREAMALSEAQKERERLQGMLRLKGDVQAPALAARVIGKDPSNWFRSILIDKGSRDGINRNSAVLSPEGLVGRVMEVMEGVSRVQLITDPDCAVGALNQRSRVGGVVVGEVGPYCRLKFLPQDADVSVGDLILTSGLSGLSPKGIPIGVVTETFKKENALFQEARIAPRVDLSRIEEVLVLGRSPRSEIGWQED